VLGISFDSIESHKKFIEKHGLNDITLLSDKDRTVTGLYGVKHWLLPVAKRVFIVVDKRGTIIFHRDAGLSRLENQTKTLLDAIDSGIR
jgi:peroxiredoxin